MATAAVTESAKELHEMLTKFLLEIDPVVLVVGTATVTYTAHKLWTMHRDDIGLRKRSVRNFFSLVRAIPAVRRIIHEKISEVEADLHDSVRQMDRGEFICTLPENGRDKDAFAQLLDRYQGKEQVEKYLSGRVSGAVFNNERDEAEVELYAEVLRRFAFSNPLWPKLFPGIRQMEAEVVRMCCNLMHGDDNSSGIITTGGTMSILHACLAHRNRALKKGIMFPEMVIPVSAHAAFIKAAELFRIKLVLIPLNKKTFKVDLDKMRAAITSRTCMLLGSAPNFPYGSMDDIEAIGKLGLKYDIPVHVDACLGGFLLPFISDKRPFDFSVPGVSSISADTHKYGLSPKGSSVLLFRTRELLQNQFFCDPNWTGGIYASSSMEGSRSGLLIAMCWASMLYRGQQQYREMAETVVSATRKIRDGIASIPELRLQGASDICIVSWTSDSIDINRFHHMMLERGWNLSALQFPTGVHIMVTPHHDRDEVVEALISDARLVVKQIVANPKELTGSAALYGMAQKIPDRSIVQEFAYAYLHANYSQPAVENQ